MMGAGEEGQTQFWELKGGENLVVGRGGGITAAVRAGWDPKRRAEGGGHCQEKEECPETDPTGLREPVVLLLGAEMGAWDMSWNGKPGSCCGSASDAGPKSSALIL